MYELTDRIAALGCYTHTVKNLVRYLTLWCANHTIIRVINTLQCKILHQLVWYAIKLNSYYTN